MPSSTPNSTSFSYRKLFDVVAPHYEARIIRAFAPYAANLIEWANPLPHETLLDIGTGTGIAARLAAVQAQQVIGLDFSIPMLQSAQSAARNLVFIQADAHALPFIDSSFDLVIASFGFNATRPQKSLKESFRVLRPGGRLVFQEWGGLHKFDQLVGDVIAHYTVEDDDAPPELVALRDFLDADRVWHEDLQVEEDYQEFLDALGFVNITAHEFAPLKLRLSVEDFIDYKTAWTSQLYEFAAMSPTVQRACLAELENRLYRHADEDGILTYDPLTFRVMAYRTG
ncbi:MAG: methyltransferase domain-containing protein [Anaerolineae bacterium]|nr:methyltransferase domain-containing protein [Anaerolineae bacterium]